MMWLLSTEELRVLHGRLVHTKNVLGKLSPRALAAAEQIEVELWHRTGKPVDTPLTMITVGVITEKV